MLVLSSDGFKAAGLDVTSIKSYSALIAVIGNLRSFLHKRDYNVSLLTDAEILSLYDEISDAEKGWPEHEFKEFLNQFKTQEASLCSVLSGVNLEHSKYGLVRYTFQVYLKMVPTICKIRKTLFDLGFDSSLLNDSEVLAFDTRKPMSLDDYINMLVFMSR